MSEIPADGSNTQPGMAETQDTQTSTMSETVCETLADGSNTQPGMAEESETQDIQTSTMSETVCETPADGSNTQPGMAEESESVVLSSATMQLSSQGTENETIHEERDVRPSPPAQPSPPTQPSPPSQLSPPMQPSLVDKTPSASGGKVIPPRREKSPLFVSLPAHYSKQYQKRIIKGPSGRYRSPPETRARSHGPLVVSLPLTFYWRRWEELNSARMLTDKGSLPCLTTQTTKPNEVDTSGLAKSQEARRGEEKQAPSSLIVSFPFTSILPQSTYPVMSTEETNKIVKQDGKDHLVAAEKTDIPVVEVCPKHYEENATGRQHQISWNQLLPSYHSQDQNQHKNDSELACSHLGSSFSSHQPWSSSEGLSATSLPVKTTSNSATKVMKNKHKKSLNYVVKKLSYERDTPEVMKPSRSSGVALPVEAGHTTAVGSEEKEGGALMDISPSRHAQGIKETDPVVLSLSYGDTPPAADDDQYSVHVSHHLMTPDTRIDFLSPKDNYTYGHRKDRPPHVVKISPKLCGEDVLSRYTLSRGSGTRTQSIQSSSAREGAAVSASTSQSNVRGHVGVSQDQRQLLKKRPLQRGSEYASSTGDEDGFTADGFAFNVNTPNLLDETTSSRVELAGSKDKQGTCTCTMICLPRSRQSCTCTCTCT